MKWINFALTLFLMNVKASEKGNKYTELLGIKLEHSNIASVVSSFGMTKIIESGDAAEYSKRLNYYFPIEKAYVTFDVCEMGGESTITLFHLSNKAPKEEFRNVSGVKFSKKDIGELRVGMTKKEFCRNLALTQSCDRDSITEFYLDSIPMTQSEIEKSQYPPNQKAMWDICISVTGKFKNQKLVDLYLNKNITN